MKSFGFLRSFRRFTFRGSSLCPTLCGKPNKSLTTGRAGGLLGDYYTTRAGNAENGHSGAMHIGLIGLGTMGANLARNAARNGATVSVYNRTTEKTDAFIKAHGSEGAFMPCKTIDEFLK